MYNGRPLSIVPPDKTIFSDASKQGWGATCQGISTGAQWSHTGGQWSHHLANWESRNFHDSSEWKLCLMSFKIICKQFGTPLFASRLCHQLPRYISWRPDPQSIATDALHQDWKNQFCYAFPPFSLIGRVLRKVQKDQTKLIIVTPAWQSQSWYPTLLKMAIADPFLLPKHQKILLNPEGKIHPLVQNSTLRLVAWLVPGKTYLQREYQKGLLTLSQIPEGKVLSSQL